MPDYKFSQQSGDDWKVNTSDKADAYEDTNEIRAIVDDLGAVLGHSKKDGSFPEDLTSGGTITQITFPATQVPSAGANVLDDYEEGAWTPALRFGGNSVDMVYTTQAGLYTKIGRQVTVTGYIILSNKGTSTGDAIIFALPFTSKNVAGANSPVLLRMVNVTYANAFQGNIYKNTTYIYLQELTEGGTETNLTNADFANNSTIALSATYFTD